MCDFPFASVDNEALSKWRLPQKKNIKHLLLKEQLSFYKTEPRF